MPRSEHVHRVKSYSAATGYVYQYYFLETQKSRRGLHAGTDYVYMVAVDRGAAFPLCVFVRRDAIRKWSKKSGRGMTGTEEYAAVKMRLFQAFDEVEDLAAVRPDVTVDDTNLEALLAQLDL